LALVTGKSPSSDLSPFLARSMALPAILSAAHLDPRLDDADSAVRLRLVGCRVEHGREAMTDAFVECDGPLPGQRTTGRQKGTTCPGGDLRLAALATLDAVTQATCGALRLELLGVKPMRAFDTTLVVVAVIAHHEGKTTRIVGAALADDDLLVGTARAALHAVNRLASPLLARLVD
jgi:hypothetical protein